MSLVSQQRNPEMVDILSSDFIKLKDAGFGLARAFGTYMYTPSLRGFWNMAAIDSSTNVMDMSPHGMTLTNNGATAFLVAALTPYALMDGVNNYLSRATEANLAITGRLSLSTWVYFGTAAGSAEFIVGKKGAAGQLGYYLYRNTSGLVTAEISTNGTATTQVVSTASISTLTWYFVAMVYNPSTELSVWVNTTETTNTTSIPATVHNSTAPFTVGASGVPDQFLTGRITNVILSATNISDTQVFALREQSRVNFPV